MNVAGGCPRDKALEADMMDGYGHGNMGWGNWLGMSLAITVWRALVVVLAVWAARAFEPSTHLTRVALDARLAGLQAEVAHPREQAHLTHRDGAGTLR